MQLLDASTDLDGQRHFRGLYFHAHLRPFAAHKQSSIDALTAFNDDYPIESFDSLIEDITNKKQQNYYEQTLTNVDFTQIVTSIIKSIPESKAAFANLKGKISGQMFSTERINLIEELIK